ncbi:class A beta-lactamase [Staphylococcus equorum]|uniref:class A beta-lactamase n=1 Tax=Staphylococcus equorum TaxID=246432 RepID=UPI000623E4F7|nr:class A beta-lactamase [Staphylococcus equorum]ANR67297.1 BlaZ family class A beta-lactamase [Staphylococcus equorum]KKI54839.1 Beta-lactamase [Staphylococcus equorum subsp. equorum]MDK9847589.1 class A beta-lactamase [Staphylococcus equorum]PTE24787.1 class A beta-lactamase [Staphylococcus equorum]PTE84230.1 class A beta-lactamase [Staphylococcus equorum]
MKKVFWGLVFSALFFMMSNVTVSANEFDKIEKDNNTTVGVYGINTENGKKVQHNANERFAFASTFKAIASGVLLNNYSEKDLNKKITINEADIVEYSPVTENYIGKQMTLKDLIKASMLQSDNTANNKIMEELGGVKAFKHELKQLGDNISNPQRLEPELNLYDPNSTADTTTPRAAAQTLNKILTSDQISDGNLDLLKQVMIENETGDSLIKAGVPDNYIVGDKSGQGLTYATRNDLAFIYPDKHKKPIFLAIYTKQDDKDGQPDDKVIADAAEEAIAQLR